MRSWRVLNTSIALVVAFLALAGVGTFLPPTPADAQAVPITVWITVTAAGKTTTITDKPATIEVPMQTQVTYTATASDNVRALGLYNISFWDEQKNQSGPSESEPATSVTRSLGPILVELTLVYSARVEPRMNSKGPVAKSAAVTIRWVKPAATPVATTTQATAGAAAKASATGTATVAVASTKSTATPTPPSAAFGVTDSDSGDSEGTDFGTGGDGEGPSAGEIAIATTLILTLLGITVLPTRGDAGIATLATASTPVLQVVDKVLHRGPQTTAPPMPQWEASVLTMDGSATTPLIADSPPRTSPVSRASAPSSAPATSPTPRLTPITAPVVPYNPPGHLAASGVNDLADRVKSTSESVKKHLDDIPMSQGTKKQLSDGLDKVADGAGTVSDIAAGVDRTIQAIDKNYEETEGRGIPDGPRDFLAWWRALWGAGSEVTQVYVDEQLSHLPKGAQEKIKEALPITEFGQEMGNFPTRAARTIRHDTGQWHTIREQNRDIYREIGWDQ